MEAGLWFRYGRQKRPEVTASSTFEAVLRGERTSTTRFLRWPGHSQWAAVRPGDQIRFHANQDKSGPTLIVRVSTIQPVNLFTCSADDIELWSRHEGWTVAKGRALGAELGPALWLKHELVSPGQPTPPAQMALF